MEILFQAMRQDTTVARVLAAFGAQQGQSLAYGLAGPQKAACLGAAYHAFPRTTVIVTSTRETLEELRTDLAALLPQTAILELPPLDMVTFAAAAKSIELAAMRMDVLGRLARGEKLIVLASAEAASQKAMPKEDFLHSRFALTPGDLLAREEFLAGLVRFGYERVDQVESRGQFSVRGGILDVYPVNRPFPLRVEFFGDEIDSLREFEPTTQRSLTNLPQADILPLAEPEHAGKPTCFLTYLPAGSAVIFDEPARLREQLGKLVKENPELKRQLYGWPELTAAAKAYSVLYVSLMLQKTPYTEPAEINSVTVKGIAPFHRQTEMFVDELKGWQARDRAIVVFMHNREKALALQQNLTGERLRAIYADGSAAAVPGAAVVTVGMLRAGFELPQGNLVVVTETDIYGRQKRKRLPRVAKERQIAYFRDINIGDYVVHVNHGIGKYTGVETLEVAGVHKDYLLIRYAGEDKLYVPTDQVHLLQKYIGSEGEAPRLSRMGGSDWLKAKTRAKAAATDLAKELLALYAERRITQGYAFPPDTPWQKEFEEAFPFEETPDQLTAIAEIKADMERDLPMDRLLCGDVGFGKTEVALRAAFKAVMGGKQVAVLVPTTVLAQQHFQTFSTRFAGFGPATEMISRFRSPREQREITARVARGQVDVLIGTHRILNGDVEFKELGLLIVDEEQRFGVAQKERLKKWRTNVDVLTLTATPIPRTLHMSLVGVRDMSVIETPPEDRLPVQTYVVEYRDEIIADAIRRELKRNGQVYFVYNRVQTIDKISAHLSDLFPDARIGVAHGQMAEELLERVMVDFYEGHYDILVCTSIIENGLDVSNANTIIVYDSDRFGLSQLYQMRGRVGRSHRMAYAYFTYRREKVLSEVAEKRLQAIKEFAELGAGFKIAMRDLEIRGAGNLLGSQQHGHIVSVGFEMYCNLLDEAVQELRHGHAVEPPPEPVLEFNVDAYLDGDYIGDAMHKIEIYQRIAAIRTEENVREMLDELIDRFGEPTQPVLNLLAVARIKNFARSLGARSVIERPGMVEITFGENPNVEVQRLLALKEKYSSRVSIYPGPPEAIRLRTARLATPLLDWLVKLLGEFSGQPIV
ncbi:MAG TPA: transcription-repair coupling factor [Selenomonadales bacterium]|nr:transcription-repair coupling factor [Selenomonadales bacterium]